jgi:hypothetical protein
VQIAFGEGRGLYAQGFGQAIYVYVSKNGAGSFAAVGAGQAIGLGKNFVVGLLKSLIKRLGLDSF